MQTVSLILALGLLGTAAPASLPNTISSTNRAPAGYEWQAPTAADSS
jgi:hypothetical protein